MDGFTYVLNTNTEARPDLIEHLISQMNNYALHHAGFSVFQQAEDGSRDLRVDKEFTDLVFKAR